MKARERGAKIIHIDPHYSRTSSLSDLYAPIRAGSDIAFLGGLIRHIIETESYFRDYVVHYTNAGRIIREEYKDAEDLDRGEGGRLPSLPAPDEIPAGSGPVAGAASEELPSLVELAGGGEGRSARLGDWGQPGGETDGALLDRWVFQSDVCKHCTNAGCLDACPTGALIRTEFETVIVQSDICNGCGYCVASCPFGVIDRDPYDGRAAKCTLCYDRLQDGLEPACAKACPTDSIQFGPYEELVETAKKRVVALHERGMTRRVPLRRGRRAGRAARGRARRLLPAHRAARALRPARPGRVAGPGERPDGHGGRPRRRRRGRGGRDAAPRHRPPAARMSHHPKGPPPEERIRRRDLARPQPSNRDMTPAVGRRGQAGGWRRAVEGAKVALAKPNWGDARWSYLYGRGDTRYAVAEATNGSVPEAARQARGGDQITVPVRGPMLNPPVWTWQVPLYFWFGGIAAGSSFIAVACDAAGDERSARIARRVTLGAVGPGGPLLIMDLGRPERFFNMLRIFKPRSPMSMGSWCLAAFSSTAGSAVGADLLGRSRPARALGVPTAVLGLYLGSYSAILLCATAVPLWARSRAYLPPIFVSTALATASAANRLVLVATGVPADHPTRRALGDLETLAMTAELVLSEVNERRLGELAEGMEHGRPGKLFKFARGAVIAGLATRLVPGRAGAAARHAASVGFLLAGLAYRFAWVEAGKANAADDEVVARMARTKARPAGREPVAPPAPR